MIFPVFLNYELANQPQYKWTKFGAFTLQAPGIRETKQFIPERPVPEGTHLQLKQIETK